MRELNSFKEADQVRLILKMKLSNYCVYKGSSVIVNDDKYAVLIQVSKLNNYIKNIPLSVNGIKVKIDVN